MKTIEVPAIIEEARAAGCKNADQIHGYLAGDVSRLRSLLQQMLDVAENADETGYVTDVGFVDLGKLHGQVRTALGIESGSDEAERVLDLFWRVHPRDAERIMNPGPDFFREAAVAAATGKHIPRAVSPEVRYWTERALGLKPNQGLFGFPDYGTGPDHARVIAFLWLELLAREQA